MQWNNISFLPKIEHTSYFQKSKSVNKNTITCLESGAAFLVFHKIEQYLAFRSKRNFIVHLIRMIAVIHISWKK